MDGWLQREIEEERLDARKALFGKLGLCDDVVAEGWRGGEA